MRFGRKKKSRSKSDFNLGVLAPFLAANTVILLCWFIMYFCLFIGLSSVSSLPPNPSQPRCLLFLPVLVQRIVMKAQRTGHFHITSKAPFNYKNVNRHTPSLSLTGPPPQPQLWLAQRWKWQPWMRWGQSASTRVPGWPSRPGRASCQAVSLGEQLGQCPRDSLRNLCWLWQPPQRG